jgi:Mlc titration factor MtfA (ptsG expression regulator)
VEAGLPFLGHLTDEEHGTLRRLTLQFLSDKEFSGGKDFVVDNEARLSIALQACLLVLHLGLERYDDWVGIIVYPGDFVIPREIVDADGVVHEYDDAVLGEAWPGGPVLISWFADASQLDGVNVVLHEFAHKLDMQNGVADGEPRLPGDMPRAAWRSAFQSAYDDFCRRVDAGEDTDLDPYAAEAPAEFFAVMSEAFFETPHLLRSEYPAVYRQLRRFYGQDPAIRS